MHREATIIAGIQDLCEEFRRYNKIDDELYERFDVKRGLRNQDGTGVMAGLTQICNVHGYVVNRGRARIGRRRPLLPWIQYKGFGEKYAGGGALRI